MNTRSVKTLILMVAVLALVLAGTGCSPLSALTLIPAPACSTAEQEPASTEAVVEVAPPVSVVADVDALQSQIIAVYQEASPAVVNITSRSYVYDRFMGAIPQEGTGSGFVYDSEGHIVTNYHVVEDAEELSVTLADGRVYPATVVGTDPSNDLAVIHIGAGTDGLPQPIALTDSDDLHVGQFVIAIGHLHDCHCWKLRYVIDPHLEGE